jgi:hypothetical protein
MHSKLAYTVERTRNARMLACPDALLAGSDGVSRLCLTPPMDAPTSVPRCADLRDAPAHGLSSLCALLTKACFGQD